MKSGVKLKTTLPKPLGRLDFGVLGGAWGRQRSDGPPADDAAVFQQS